MNHSKKPVSAFSEPPSPLGMVEMWRYSWYPSRTSDYPDIDAADIEQGQLVGSHLLNTTVSNMTWRGVTVTVKDRDIKGLRNIVDNVDGVIEAGEMCAFMGPSGCSKTTLLFVGDCGEVSH